MILSKRAGIWLPLGSLLAQTYRWPLAGKYVWERWRKPYGKILLPISVLYRPAVDAVNLP
jgi:hypothetical protein